MIALALGVSLGLTAVFGLLAYRAEQSLRDVQSSILIDAYFDPTLSTAQAEEIARGVVNNSRDIAFHQFISKEDALAEYESTTGQNVQSILGKNPLPASLHIRLRDATTLNMEEWKAKLTSTRGITDVSYDAELLEAVEHRSENLRILTLIIAGLLLSTTIVVTIVATRLAIETREVTLRTLSLLGASRWQLQAPIAIEGFVGGLIGGAIAVALFLLLDRFALSAISPELSYSTVSLEQGLLTGGIIVIAGALFGGITSWVTAFWYTRRL